MTTYDCPVYLNYLSSISKTRAPGVLAPTHSGSDLLGILARMCAADDAILEINRPAEAASDEDPSFLRISRVQRIPRRGHTYIALLIEYADATQKLFPVLHRQTYKGRELSGDSDETGVVSTHVTVRMPQEGDNDGALYRCMIQVNHSIPRTHIETLFNRLLDKFFAGPLTFEIDRPNRKGKIERKFYKYNPKLELIAEVGQSIRARGGISALSQMVFTNRGERESVAAPTEVLQSEVLADVTVKIDVSQAPEEPEQRRGWVDAVRNKYERRGYTTKLYFRTGGTRGVVGGRVDREDAFAADVLFCPREVLTVDEEVKRWHPELSTTIVEAMVTTLDNDDLWKQRR